MKKINNLYKKINDELPDWETKFIDNNLSIRYFLFTILTSTLSFTLVCLSPLMLLLCIVKFVLNFKISNIKLPSFTIKDKVKNILLQHEFNLLTHNPNGFVLKNRTDPELLISIPDNYKLFLKLFFIDFNLNCDTFSNVNNLYICRYGRRRSLGDIFLITKNYYPNITIIEVLKELKQLMLVGNLSVRYCGDINKIVFWDAGYSNNFPYYPDNNTEYSKRIKFITIIQNIDNIK